MERPQRHPARSRKKGASPARNDRKFEHAGQFAGAVPQMIRPRRPVMTSLLYHQGNRACQDQFDSRRLADRLEEKMSRAEFSDDDKNFVESCIYFFIATADASGHPDCSFKGGAPGFVRVTGPSELAFPDYDGNGMFKSIGNLAVNPHVGLLFIAMHGTPKRLRINGNARIDRDDPLLPDTVGAQLIVRIEVDVIFPNCPRKRGPRKSHGANARHSNSERNRMAPVSILLNILWIVFGGLWMAAAWVIAAFIMAITIIGLPWARAALNIAVYTLLPFGQKAVRRDSLTGRPDIGTGPLGLIGNVIWLLLAGWWLALGHIVTAIALAVTIIGIPFAWAHLKLAGIALWPIGKVIVPA